MATRTKAPKIDISGMRRRDRRTEILSELDKKHPEYIHVFQDPNATDDEMSVFGYEWVRKNTYEKGGEDSSRVKWRRDAVARIPRETNEAINSQQSEESYEMVKSMYCQGTSVDEFGRTIGNEVPEGNSPGRKLAQAKDPSKIKTNGEN